MNRRTAILLAMLLGVAWLAIYGERPAADRIVHPTRIASSNAAKQGAAPAAPEPAILAVIPRTAYVPVTAASKSGGTMFGPKSWAPPPPPPPPPAPVARVVPQKPVAPPLPFAYVGRQQHNGQWTIFLARGDVTFLVKTGDMIDGTYRVHSIDTARLVLTYLPLKEEQTIALD